MLSFNFVSIALALGGASAFDSCDIPNFDWLGMDTGSGRGAGNAMAFSQDSVFLAGYSQGTMAYRGATSTMTYTDTDNLPDVFITKIDRTSGNPTRQYVVPGSIPADGTVLRANNKIRDIATVGTSSVLAVVGDFGGSLAMPGAAPLTNNNQEPVDKNAFIAKFHADGGSSDGTVAWAVAVPSDRLTSYGHVAVDSSGNFIAVGDVCVASETQMETSRSGHTSHTRAASDCQGVVHKYNGMTGALMWERTWAGLTSMDGVVVDSSNEIYVAGVFSGTITIGGQVASQTANGRGSSIMIKLSMDGTPRYAKTIGSGSPGSHTPLAIKGDHIYMTGSNSAADSALGLSGSQGGYMVKMNKNTGNHVWAVDMPSSRSVSVNRAGDSLLAFNRFSRTTQLAGSSVTLRSRGSFDVMLLGMSAADGSGVWAEDFGGEGFDYPWTAEFSPLDDTFFVSGNTASHNITFGDQTHVGVQHRSAGGDGTWQLFFAKFSEAGTRPSCVTSCSGSNMARTRTVTSGHCFIDHKCYSHNEASPYGSNAQTCNDRCMANTNQFEWTGQATIDNRCTIGGSCYNANAVNPSASCQRCVPSSSTSDWTTNSGYHIVAGSGCTAMPVYPSSTGVGQTSSSNAATLAISALQNEMSVSSWDTAYGHFTGNGGSMAPRALADSLCSSYDTCMSDGVHSLISFMMMQAFTQGRIAAGSSSIPARADATVQKDRLIGLIHLVYYQAALREAYNMDASASTSAQGLGNTYYSIIRTPLRTANPDLDARVARFFNPSNAISGVDHHYCPLKNLLMHNLPTATSPALFGTLNSESRLPACPIAPAAAIPTPAAEYASCSQPTFDWVSVDQGVGRSRAFAVDAMGDSVYVGGMATGTTTMLGPIPETPRSGSVTTAGTTDADQVIYRITNEGVPTRATVIHGSRTCCSRYDALRSLAAINDGRDRYLAVGGYYRGNLTFPGASPEMVVNNRSGSRDFDGWVAKMDGQMGNFVWAKGLKTGPQSHGFNGALFTGNSSYTDTSSDSSYLYSVTGDPAGNVYAAGDLCDRTDGQGNPNMNSDGTSLSRTCKGFLAKLNGDNGDVMWTASYLGTDDFLSVRVDPMDMSVYVAGGFRGTNVSIGNGNLPRITSASGGGSESIYLLKLDSSGNPLWHWHAGRGFASHMAISAGHHHIFVSGSCYSQGFSWTNMNGQVVSYTCSGGGFLAKVNAMTGETVWVAELGSTYSNALATSPDGRFVYLMDPFTNSQTMGSFTVRSHGSWDTMVAKIDAHTGEGYWATALGGTSSDYFYGVGSTADGSILVAGYAASTTLFFGGTNHTMASRATASNADALVVAKLSNTESTPSCLLTCGATTTVRPGFCYVNGRCIRHGETSPYQGCFSCNANADQLSWFGPDTTNHCYISGTCYAEGEPKLISRYDGPSTCEKCRVAVSTSTWSVEPGYRLNPRCSRLPTVTMPATPPADLTAALQTSDAAGSLATTAGVVLSLTSPPNPVGVTEATLASARAEYMSSTSTLRQLAERQWPGSQIWTATRDFYGGSPTFAHDYIVQAFDGTGPFTNMAEESRALSITMTTTVVLPLYAAMATLQEVGHTTEAAWQHAAAYFSGTTLVSSPVNAANAVCLDVGTCASDGITSSATFDIMTALSAGLGFAAPSGGNPTDAANEMTIFFDQVRLVLSQISLTLAHQLDQADNSNPNDNGDAQDSQASAATAFGSIAAHLGNDARAGHVLQLLTGPTSRVGSFSYCSVKSLVDAAMQTWASITPANLGALAAAASVDCTNAPQPSPPLPSPPSPSPPSEDDSEDEESDSSDAASDSSDAASSSDAETLTGQSSAQTSESSTADIGGGAIAGIVIAAVVLVVAIIGGVVFVCTRKKTGQPIFSCLEPSDPKTVTVTKGEVKDDKI
jgi:hypothetical protein